ncbi:MAG: hypothetical protein AAF465_15835 [Pseudomonadota bacterium]
MLFKLLLVANAVWFAMGFHLFVFRNTVFAKILVPKAYRDSPAFDVLVESGKFLGGFNFALCAFNLVLLAFADAFNGDSQRIILCLFFALAHGSQFYFNFPIWRQNRMQQGVWQVQGLMRFIFVTDFVLMLANTLMAALIAWG